jgi:hypothetical protein
LIESRVGGAPRAKIAGNRGGSEAPLSRIGLFQQPGMRRVDQTLLKITGEAMGMRFAVWNGEGMGTFRQASAAARSRRT